MPFYVPDPDNAGLHVDVNELQRRDPSKLLEPVLLPQWLDRDTWSRREALMLLAGFNPNITQWTESDQGFGQYPAGHIGFLDGTTWHLLGAVNVRHPRSSECQAEFWKLSEYARCGSLDERRSPQAWIAWAATKRFEPYWRNAFNDDDQKNSNIQAFNPIGLLTGFSLAISRSEKSATVTSGRGSLHLTNNRIVNYEASSMGFTLRANQQKARIYFIDELLNELDAINDDTAQRRQMSLLVDTDETSLRGIYPGGLIVLGQVEIPQAVGDQRSPSSRRPIGQQAHQENEIKRVLADLGYDLMALPKAIAGKPGAKKSVRAMLNFSVTVFNKAWERLRLKGEIKDA